MVGSKTNVGPFTEVRDCEQPARRSNKIMYLLIPIEPSGVSKVTVRSMRLEPRRSHPGFDFDWHVHRHCARHELFNERHHVVRFLLHTIEHELIMHLHDHDGLQLSLFYFAVRSEE